MIGTGRASTLKHRKFVECFVGNKWPNGRCAELWVEGSGFETWPVNVNTLLSQ